MWKETRFRIFRNKWGQIAIFSIISNFICSSITLSYISSLLGSICNLCRLHWRTCFKRFQFEANEWTISSLHNRSMIILPSLSLFECSSPYFTSLSSVSSVASLTAGVYWFREKYDCFTISSAALFKVASSRLPYWSHDVQWTASLENSELESCSDSVPNSCTSHWWTTVASGKCVKFFCSLARPPSNITPLGVSAYTDCLSILNGFFLWYYFGVIDSQYNVQISYLSCLIFNIWSASTYRLLSNACAISVNIVNLMFRLIAGTQIAF